MIFDSAYKRPLKTPKRVILLSYLNLILGIKGLSRMI